MDTPDVLIVGAGSAGATLAGRLSEEPTRSVLLLEAGPDHTAADTPATVQGQNFFAAVMEPGRIWPNIVASRSAGRAPSIYVRGRGVGGSSAVNAMVAIRGTDADYARWADDLGCAGWGAAEMLDAFLHVEDDLDHGGDGRHGRGGPIPLWRRPEADRAPLDDALRRAMAELGYPTADDYHALGATGVSRAALTVRDGRRVSTNEAYLEPARDRTNLVVRGDVLVDRVAFDGSRAVGVVTAEGESIAAREVVISAGAIHSPAILLRSGSVDRPVGENLREHACTPGFDIALRPEGRTPDVGAPVLTSLLRYSSGLADAGPNDMQMLWFDAVGPNPEGLAGGRLIGAVMRVFSSGRVRLRSDDPHDDPVVEFDLLSDDRDLVRLRDCTRRMIDVVRHPAVAAISDAVLADSTPLEDLESDADIDAWLAVTVNDYVHAAGTCRMGRADDPRAVVDRECRVIGTKRLRVCDASVMPDLPRANTHLTTVAMAERLVRHIDAP